MNLSGTRITDAGLAYLKDATKLERLELRGTQITDAGLEHLKNLTGLQWLAVSGTRVTEAGVQELKRSLPNLTEMRGQGQSTAESVNKPTTASVKTGATALCRPDSQCQDSV
jgi:hypothetical protein